MLTIDLYSYLVEVWSCIHEMKMDIEDFYGLEMTWTQALWVWLRELWYGQRRKEWVLV